MSCVSDDTAPQAHADSGVSLLLISGSVRDGSTNTAALRTAAALCPAGVHARLFDGLDRLPHFNPDLDASDPQSLDPRVADLRRQIAAADAMLICTPEYAGAMPGALKNLLEWTVGGTETTDKPVAWINLSTMPAEAANTHDSLRTVLGYTGARVVDEACARIPVARQAVGSDGIIADEGIREHIRQVIARLLAAVG
jgi:NAD(P)H-dependent FMN reductase